MKLLLSSPVVWGFSPTEALRIAADLGYDGVELWAYHLRRDKAEPRELAQEAKRRGLILTLHALSWDLNPASSLEPVRTTALRLLNECIELAASLEAQVLVLHPGRVTVPSDNSAPYWAFLVEGLQTLARHARRFDVPMAIEHMEPLRGELVISPEDMQRLLSDVDVPELACTFDLAHVPWGEEPIPYYERMPAVVHIHLSDANESRYHLPLGQGRRDLAAFVRHLESTFDGCVVVEGIEHRRTVELASANKQFWDHHLLK